MNGDTGESELAVHSDFTVTIGYVKAGLVTDNDRKRIKRLICTDIGIILIREEEYITEETRPPWLDLNVLSAIE